MSPNTNIRTQNYFPNLNALRFIAASMVLIGHTEQIKGFHSYKCYFLKFPFLFQGGHLAVIFFFVLSGFLITHIIKTKLNSDKFSVSNFYKKRVVRIWPLYYFIILLGLYVIPQLGFMAHNSEWVGTLSQLTSEEMKLTTFFYLIVLPNVSIFFGVFEYLGHTWSIGVEEQFYLIWPLLMKWFKNHTLRLLVGVVLIVWSLRIACEVLNWDLLHAFWSLFRIDSMAIGGLPSIVLLNHPSVKKCLVNSWTEIVALLAIAGFYFCDVDFCGYADEFYSILFSIVIVNAAANPKTLIRLEGIKPLSYLGQVSYGIYMYHPITAMLSLLLFNAIRPSYMASLSSNLVFYGLVFVVSTTTAVISYELIEKRIMNWGRKKWLKQL
ncbi:acyltransferase [Flavobacteriales bacterium]|nr:acyltransferase [Flavobacteriales bacterium]